jgi:Prp8 binding protein
VDGKVLASAGIDKNVLVWRAACECENIAILKGHSNAITCLSFEHTNDYIYTASADKSLIVWDIEATKLVKKYKGHTAVVHSVSSPQKLLNLMASASDDGFVKVFDTRLKKQTHDFTNKHPMTSVCMSESGESVFAGSIDNNMKCYNLKTGKTEYTMEGHMDTVSSLALSQD